MICQQLVVHKQFKPRWEKQHDNSEALRELNGILQLLETINAHFSAYPDIYSDEALLEVRREVDARIDAATEKLWGFTYLFKSQGQVWHATKLRAVLSLSCVAQILLWALDASSFRLGMLLEQGKVGRLSTAGTVQPEDEMVGKADSHPLSFAFCGRLNGSPTKSKETFPFLFCLGKRGYCTERAPNCMSGHRA